MLSTFTELEKESPRLGSNGFRRSNIEIIASILEACRYGTCKTRVMHLCNLSSRQLEGYVDLLLKASLLIIENDHRSFMLVVSSKGKCFLNTYRAMKTMIEKPLI
jgi:predicted transcriptional regulator